MNTWVCIAWEDRPASKQFRSMAKTIPAPVTKAVHLHPRLTQAQVLSAFKLKFPFLRNHTVHPYTQDLAVTHNGPGNYPIAVPKNKKSA